MWCGQISDSQDSRRKCNQMMVSLVICWPLTSLRYATKLLLCIVRPAADAFQDAYVRCEIEIDSNKESARSYI